ncbi:MAG: phospholipid carrier-dependent glycosyltransferase, partial [Chloroflexi bacterium]
MARRIAYCILVVFAILAGSYGRAMPPFESADEAPHFLYSHHLLIDKKLPRILSRQVIAQQTDPTRAWSIETHQPPLYYMIGALLISPTKRDDLTAYLRPNEAIFTMNITEHNPNKWLHPPGIYEGDTHIALWILRGFSILLGMVTLWCVYQTGRLIFEDDWLPVISMGLVAFIPTFLSISASVNNDNLVTTLYALGVYWSLRLWKKLQIRWQDTLVLSLILSAIILTKLTGASLYVVVFGALMWGVHRGYYARRDALRLAGVVVIVSFVLAGWWYLRNWQLYGDPLAFGATRSIWGREYEIAATSGDWLAELLRIGKSFWMMVGHLHEPVYGPTWVYIYVGFITIIGLFGLIRYKFCRQDTLILLVGVCGLLIAVLLMGTRSIDISYGRLLFPALVAFAPLMVAGWSHLLTRLGTMILLFPLILIAVTAPSIVISRAYSPLEPFSALPEDIPLIGAESGNLRLLAYEVQQMVLNPNDTMTIDLYLRGSHPDNPMLMLTALDSVTNERLGFTGVFPGMAATDSLDPDQLYKARVQLKLDEVGDVVLSPRMIRLQVVWFSPSLFEALPMTDGAGNPIETLLLDGTLLIDERYTTPDTRYEVDVVFGDAIRLTGYTISNTDVRPGETVDVILNWDVLQPLADDWTLTVQLIQDGVLVDQHDGMLPGYPSTFWREDTSVQIVRQLTVPLNAPLDATYHILLAW